MVNVFRYDEVWSVEGELMGMIQIHNIQVNFRVLSDSMGGISIALLKEEPMPDFGAAFLVLF